MAGVRRWLALALLCGCASLGGAAVPPVKLPARPVDFSKLPPGTIIVIAEDGKDALQHPGVVVLSPEKFRDLLDEMERLKRQAAPEKPEAPSSLRLSGDVKDNVVRLKIQYEFETRKKKQLVALCGQKASANTSAVWPTAVTLDEGRLPLLPPPGEDGLIVQVENAGAHKLTLEVEIPVAPRALASGAGHGFELGLPRAAITVLEHLDLPSAARDATLNGRPLTPKDLHSGNDRRKEVPLGACDRLDVVWKGAAAQPAQPLLTAAGVIDVHLDEGQAMTVADLTLETRGGPTAQWQVHAPAQATLEVLDLPAADPRGPAIVAPPEGKTLVWTIRLKEASDKPLKVRIRHRQARPTKPREKLAIGPFAVAQTIQQTGTITVSATPELRPRFPMRPDLSQREVPEALSRGPGSVHVFAYWNLPPARADQPAPALLDIETEIARGTVETETAYTLRLTEEGWQLTAVIDVTPSRSAVEALEFDVPADYALKASPGSHVESDPLEFKEKEAVNGRRVGVVKLTARQRQRFAIKLEGLIPLGKGSPLFLGLPRPTQTIDKGAKLAVLVPEGWELLAAHDLGTETQPAGSRERSWKLDKCPPRLELAWREHRPELAVEASVDVTIAPRRALVRQRLRFLSPLAPGKEMLLRAGDFPAGQAPVVGNTPLFSRGGGVWPIILKESVLTVDYSVPLPPPDKQRSRLLSLPLFWPDCTTRCLTKVRVWSEAGTQASLGGGTAWEELPTEVVPERETLPGLVLRATSPEVPLTLRLAESVGSPLANLAVDRVLVQALVVEGGQQTYRARFLLTKVGARAIDVELPGSPAALNFEAFLNGRPVADLVAIDDEGRESEIGRVARLRVEPELFRKPTVLEVRYQLPAGRGDGVGNFVARLQPPRLRDNAFPGRIRWEVALPNDWVAAVVGGQSSAEQRWGWRHGLPVPYAAATELDLERWFAAGSDPNLWNAEVEAELATRRADLLCWQAALEPLPVFHATRQTWLLVCSLTVLTLGLVLQFARLPRFVVGSIVALVAATIVVAAVVAPGALDLIASGCLPGVLVLLLVAGIQWGLRRRYRRQVVFMPGFSRLAPGSSIVRGNSSQRRREPSTVDVPPVQRFAGSEER